VVASKGISPIFTIHFLSALNLKSLYTRAHARVWVQKRAH